MALELDFLQGRILEIARSKMAEAFEDGVSAPNISISGIEGFDKLTEEQKQLVSATFNLFLSSLCAYQSQSPVLLEPINNWAPSSEFGTPSIAFGIDGSVSLEGGVSAGSSQHCLSIPSSYRPLNDKLFSVVVNGVPGTLRIRSTGEVVASVANGNVCFSGVTFRR